MRRDANDRKLFRRVFLVAIATAIVLPVMIERVAAGPASEFQTVPLAMLPGVSFAENQRDRFRRAYRGAIELRWKRKRFGGFSGLDVDRSGKRMIAISDRGSWLEADLIFRDGRLVGARKVTFKRLRGTDGNKLKRRDGDAEALSPDGAGGFVASFERSHRILQFPGADQSTGLASG